MAIQVKSKAVIGFRFSDVCFNREAKTGDDFYYEFLTESLEGEISKKFEDSTIDDKEVNPELIALVFDLDYFEYKWSDKDDAIIGIELAYTDAGERNVGMTGFQDVEIAARKIEACISNIDEEVAKKVRIEVGIITNIKEAQ
jgi:hypothetical protein